MAGHISTDHNASGHNASGHIASGHIALVLPQDRFFLTHFIARARAAQERGWRVTVVAPETGSGAAISAAGFAFEPLPMDRHSANPLRELGVVLHLVRLYRRIEPDLVHQVAIKPILFGTLAARLNRVPRILNALVGMGFVTSSQSAKARLLRPFLRFALARLINPPGSLAVFENAEDLAAFVAQGSVRAEASVLIRGAGVDIDTFHPTPEPPLPVTVVLAGRLIREKGVEEFVTASRLLRARGVAARFVLVGLPDETGISSIPEQRVRDWVAEGVVEWWGHRGDMPEVMRACHVFCLPSYREGLPKVVLEAMASERAIVTTDTVGCREPVRDGDNGLLVPLHDAEGLAAALARVIEDADLRHRLARRSRERVEAEFSDAVVVRQTMAVYERLLAPQQGVRLAAERV